MVTGSHLIQDSRVDGRRLEESHERQALHEILGSRAGHRLDRWPSLSRGVYGAHCSELTLLSSRRFTGCRDLESYLGVLMVWITAVFLRPERM